ncbi:hypothetical protein [Nonomuraea cavernae]|nr:hypothetical protein [Nonomuraea cavernae]MCA2189045.1 hypothetical protein [Nonomuraea cavernae]
MPELAPDITADELDKEVRDELRSLPTDLAELVGRHLVAAERALEEDDTDKAHEHTKVARRFAARIGVVREAAGIVAYRAGNFAEALSDLRAARRMTGSDAYLPIMADCERGLGRPERALDLVRSPEAERLERAERIELSIVESGARRDLGQHDASVIILQRLPELRDPQPKPWSARLAFAYADALAEAGHPEAATDWFARAMAFDEDGETDAAERYAELTGTVIEDIEEDFDDEFEADEQDAEAVLTLAEDLPDKTKKPAPADGEAGTRDSAEPEGAADVAPSDLGGKQDGPETTEPKDVAAKSPETEEVPESPVIGDTMDATGAGDVNEAAEAKDLTSAESGETEAVSESTSSAGAKVVPESADGVDTGVSGDRVDSDDDGEAAGETVVVKGDTPDINLAFIEPDFGDILDVPDEPAKEHPKHDN